MTFTPATVLTAGFVLLLAAKIVPILMSITLPPWPMVLAVIALAVSAVHEASTN